MKPLSTVKRFKNTDAIAAHRLAGCADYSEGKSPGPILTDAAGRA
jgi:hypothetical protein